MEKLIIKKSYIYMISYLFLIIFGMGGGVFLLISSIKNFQLGYIALGLIILLASLIFFCLGVTIIIAGVIWIFLLPKEIMILDDYQISWYFLKDKASINYDDISKISYYDGTLLIGGYTYQIWDKNETMHTLRVACINPFSIHDEIEKRLKDKDIIIESDWRIR